MRIWGEQHDLCIVVYIKVHTHTHNKSAHDRIKCARGVYTTSQRHCICYRVLYVCIVYLKSRYIYTPAALLHNALVRACARKRGLRYKPSYCMENNACCSLAIATREREREESVAPHPIYCYYYCELCCEADLPCLLPHYTRARRAFEYARINA